MWEAETRSVTHLQIRKRQARCGAHGGLLVRSPREVTCMKCRELHRRDKEHGC